MKDNLESVLDILAALFVLLVAMLDPRFSAGLAVVFLVALGLYKFGKRRESMTS